MEHGLSIPIILKFSIFTKLILARGFPRTWSMCSLKTREHRFESRVYQICKECIYYHSWYNGEYNRIHEFFFFKRLFSILTRYIYLYSYPKILFSRSRKTKFPSLQRDTTSFISTHRKFYVFRSSLYFTHIHCECIKFLSSTVYLEISSKILPYRLYDITFHNILLCGNVFVSVLMLVCTLVCTYVTAWNTIIINTLDKRW